MASIQESLYACLAADAVLTALVDDRIYPGQVPDDETPSPWLYYAVPESEPINQLDAGIEALHQVEFHSLGDTYAAAKAVIDAIFAALDTYTGGQITRAFWLGTSEEVTEEGYHHVARFQIWGLIASEIALPATGPRARILTSDAFRAQAGGRELVLDEDGLTLDGDPVGGVDFSGLTTGRVTYYDGSALASAIAVSYSATGTHLAVTAQAADVVPFAVITAAGQTANAIESRDNTGTTKFAVNASGTHIETASNCAIGPGANATGSSAISYGNQANAFGIQSVALGVISSAGDNAVAVGPGANAVPGGIAAGFLAHASATNAISIGNQSVCNQEASAVLGGGKTFAANEFVFGCVNGLGAIANDRLTGHSQAQQRSMAQTTALWLNSTDAIFSVEVSHRVNDYANPVTGRAYVRAAATGTDVAVGFLGGDPITRPVVSGSAAGNAALQSLLTALADLGLITDSTT